MVGAAVTSFTVVVGAVVLSFTVVRAIVISFTVVGAIVVEISVKIVVPVVVVGAVVISFAVVIPSGPLKSAEVVVVIVPPFWIVWFVVSMVLLLGDNPTPAPVPAPAMANRANRAPPMAFFRFLGFLTRIKNVTILK